MGYIWIVEDENYHLEAFESVKDAYDHAKEMINSDENLDDDDRAWALDELERTFAGDGHDGFFIGDYLYCYSVDLHPATYRGN